MKVSLQLLGLCTVIFSVACHSKRGTPAAIAATDRFHKQIAARQYEPIWLSMDESFRRSGDLTSRNLDSIHNEFGEARHFWWKGGSVESGFYFPSHLVVIEGEVEFSKGWATERFEWMVRGEHAVLMRYSIGKKFMPAKSSASQN